MNVGGTISLAGVLNGQEMQAGESHMSRSSSALTFLWGCNHHMSHDEQCTFLYHEPKLTHSTILINQPLITVHF